MVVAIHQRTMEARLMARAHDAASNREREQNASFFNMNSTVALKPSFPFGAI
jgi:hypothetical protein